MRIWGGALVRNEQGRYLQRFCEQMRAICDHVIVIDDASTDNTADFCRQYDFSVLSSKKRLWDTDEVRQRKRLFNTLTSHATPGDWILILDADELFHAPHKVVRRELEYAKIHTSFMAYRLYDIWQIHNVGFINSKVKTPHCDGLGVVNADESGNVYFYRNDEYWNAHDSYWPMAYRYEGIQEWKWNEQSLHCGRFPYNIYKNISPSNYKLLHLGWATLADRQQKYARYMKADPDGKFGIMGQYQSILDPNPTLEVAIMNIKDMTDSFIISMVHDIEELSELQKELCKYLRGNENRNKIIEEVADVEIALNDIKAKFDIKEVNIKRAKLKKGVL